MRRAPIGAPADIDIERHVQPERWLGRPAVEQLARLPQFVQRRQDLATRYHDQLAPLPLTLPADAPQGDTHAWHLYVIRLRADGAMPLILTP